MNPAKTVTLAALLVCLALGAAQAGSDFEWSPIVEDDWQLVEDPERGITDAIMIFERIVVDDKELAKKERTYYTLYRRIRILSPEGRGWGDVLSEFLRRDQKVEEIMGRTVLRDGSSFELDESQVHEKEVFVTKEFKVKQQAFSLPAVSEDCIVEYYIKYRLDGPPHRWVIQKDIHLLEGEYLWKLARGKGRFGKRDVNYGDDVVPNHIVLHAEDRVEIERRPSLKNTRELLFKVSDVPAFQSQPYSPPAVALKWQLHHYYGEPGPPSVYWGKVSEDIKENVHGFALYNDRVVDRARHFAHYDNDSRKTYQACGWLNKNVTNLDLDDSGEKRKGNGCVSHVIEHRYGSSPEICCTFYDMLREMDIDAKMAFTVDRDDDFFIEDAKYWQFTRWLVAVPEENGGYIFYKPGYDYLQPGHLDWYNEGTQALVVGDPDRLFYTTPYSTHETNTRSRQLAFTLYEDLGLSGSLTEECRGQCARGHRLGLRKTDERGSTQYLKEHAERRFPGFEPDSFSVDGLADSRFTLKLECVLEGSFAGQQVGNRLLLRPVDFLSEQDNPFTSDERKYDIMFHYAYRSTETVTIDLPEDWTVEALPEDSTFTNQIGECTVSFETEDGDLRISRSFMLSKPEWEVVSYGDVKELFASRQALNDLAVVVSR
jgi:hypothetical protein